MVSRYRASPPPNAHAADPQLFLTRWGVWDSGKAAFCTKQIYTEDYAKILASAMNMAYAAGIAEGMRGLRS